MSGERTDHIWDISNGIQLKSGSHTSIREQQGPSIDATDQGGVKDEPNHSVLLQKEFSGAALSARKLRQTLKHKPGAIISIESMGPV